MKNKIKKMNDERTLVALECGRALCMYGLLQRCQEIAPSTLHALCVHGWLQRYQEIAPSTYHAKRWLLASP